MFAARTLPRYDEPYAGVWQNARDLGRGDRCRRLGSLEVRQLWPARQTSWGYLGAARKLQLQFSDRHLPDSQRCPDDRDVAIEEVIRSTPPYEPETTSAASGPSEQRPLDHRDRGRSRNLIVGAICLKLGMALRA